MTTSDTSQPNTNTRTLADAVQPLLEALNEAYLSPAGELNISPFGQYGQSGQLLNELAIDLNIDEISPELSKRAIWTLVRKSGSKFLWNETAPAVGVESDPYKTPLRFRLNRTCFDLEYHIQWNVYLVVDYPAEDLGGGGDFDFEAAERQIALLIGYLEDEQNLDELPPEALAMFAAPPTELLINTEEKSPFIPEDND